MAVTAGLPTSEKRRSVISPKWEPLRFREHRKEAEIARGRAGMLWDAVFQAGHSHRTLELSAAMSIWYESGPITILF